MANINITLNIRGEDKVVSGTQRVSGALGNLASIAGGMLAANIFTGLARQISALVPAALDAVGFTEQLGMSLQSLIAREMMNEGAVNSMGAALEMAADPAEDLFNWVTKLALESPFDREGVATALRTGLAYGFTTDEAQRMTEAMIDFTAATGAGTPQMNQIALALGQIKAKGKVAGQEILQLVNAGIPALGLLADHFGVTTAEMQDMISSGLVPADEAYEAIIGSMEEDFGGAAERQSETITGLRNAFGDIKEMGLVALFEGLGSALLPVAAGLSDWLQGPGLKKLEEWGAALGGFVTGLIDAAGPLAAMVSNFVSWAQEEGFLRALGEFDIIPDEWVRAFDNIAAAWAEKWPEVQAIAQSFIESIQTLFGASGPQIIDSITSILNSIAELWRMYGDEITLAVTALFQFIATAISIGATTILGIIEAFLLLLQGNWQGAWDAILLTFANILLQILGLFQGPFGEIVAAVSAKFSEMGAAVTDKMAEILAHLAKQPKEWTKAGKDMIDGLIAGIKANAQAVIDTILRILQDSLNAVKAFFGITSPSDVMAGIGENLMAGLSKGIQVTAVAPQTAMREATQALMPAPVLAGAGGGAVINLTANFYGVTGDEHAVELFNTIEAEARRRGHELVN